MTTLTEIKSIVSDKHKKELLEGLAEVKEQIQKADTAESMVLMVKLNGDYVRFSSKITDTMALLAQLELLKYDILQRMKKED